MQEWLLNNFKIEAFIESGAEAWFSEARVGTVVTIARQCSDEAAREQNLVRFVSLRKTVRALIGLGESGKEQVAAVDRLRDTILGLQGHGEGSEMDWSTVTQSELRALGMR